MLQRTGRRLARGQDRKDASSRSPGSDVGARPPQEGGYPAPLGLPSQPWSLPQEDRAKEGSLARGSSTLREPDDPEDGLTQVTCM